MYQALSTDLNGWCVALTLQWHEILWRISWIVERLTTLYQMQPLFSLDMYSLLVNVEAYREDTIMAKPI
jgi:hypothetical protein